MLCRWSCKKTNDRIMTNYIGEASGAVFIRPLLVKPKTAATKQILQSFIMLIVCLYMLIQSLLNSVTSCNNVSSCDVVALLG